MKMGAEDTPVYGHLPFSKMATAALLEVNLSGHRLDLVDGARGGGRDESCTARDRLPAAPDGAEGERAWSWRGLSVLPSLPLSRRTSRRQTLSGLDEVIFSYVLGVLEDLGPSGPSEENFDMEAFIEMMEAYVPGFTHIPRGTIGDMMQKLSGQLSGPRNKENLQPPTSEVHSQVPTSPKPLQQPEKLKEETRASPAAGDTQDEAASADEELLPGVDVLLEVFPTCSVEQAQWVLAKARGDLEEAVQMLVEEKEEGPPAWDGPNQSLEQASHLQDLPRRLRGPQKDELKSFILQKYMMVDSAEDQKIHRPMAPREAPKKLIRYIDNQVVSTKGERFKDVRNPEAKEMKSTYINLKPARKYRFH